MILNIFVSKGNMDENISIPNMAARHIIFNEIHRFDKIDFLS